MKTIIFLTGLVLITVVLVQGAEARTYYIKSTVQLDSNCYHELYLRATDNTKDADGEHRNLLGKITILHTPTAGPPNPTITYWKMSFDGSKIKTPTLRVYVITDDTIDKQYLYQKFDTGVGYYYFHFRQHTDLGKCQS